jgi:hypothetical protein
VTDYLRGDQFAPPSLEEQLRRLFLDWYSAEEALPVPGMQGPLANGAWLPLPNDLVPFALYDDAVPGGTNNLAWPLRSDFSRDDSTSPPTLTVDDGVLGDVRAYGSNHGGWSGATGAKGFYIAGSDGTNQIVAIQRLAKLIRVGIGSTAVAANATFVPTSLAAMDDGQDPSNGGQTYPTVQNHSIDLPASASGIVCAWDASITAYRVIDSPPTPAAVFAALQSLPGYSSGSPQILITNGAGGGNSVSWIATTPC